VCATPPAHALLPRVGGRGPPPPTGRGRWGGRSPPPFEIPRGAAWGEGPERPAGKTAPGPVS